MIITATISMKTIDLTIDGIGMAVEGEEVVMHIILIIDDVMIIIITVIEVGTGVVINEVHIMIEEAGIGIDVIIMVDDTINKTTIANIIVPVEEMDVEGELGDAVAVVLVTKEDVDRRTVTYKIVL
jgi:hypothetical protein